LKTIRDKKMEAEWIEMENLREENDSKRKIEEGK